METRPVVIDTPESGEADESTETESKETDEANPDENNESGMGESKSDEPGTHETDKKETIESGESKEQESDSSNENSDKLDGNNVSTATPSDAEDGALDENDGIIYFDRIVRVVASDTGSNIEFDDPHLEIPANAEVFGIRLNSEISIATDSNAEINADQATASNAAGAQDDIDESFWMNEDDTDYASFSLESEEVTGDGIEYTLFLKNPELLFEDACFTDADGKKQRKVEIFVKNAEELKDAVLVEENETGIPEITGMEVGTYTIELLAIDPETNEEITCEREVRVVPRERIWFDAPTLYIGTRNTSYDLTSGMTAKDENGGEVTELYIVDETELLAGKAEAATASNANAGSGNGQLDQQGENEADAGLEKGLYHVTIGAKHPVTGEEFTTKRTVEVVDGYYIYAPDLEIPAGSTNYDLTSGAEVRDISDTEGKAVEGALITVEDISDLYRGAEQNVPESYSISTYAAEPVSTDTVAVADTANTVDAVDAAETKQLSPALQEGTYVVTLSALDPATGEKLYVTRQVRATPTVILMDGNDHILSSHDDLAGAIVALAQKEEENPGSVYIISFCTGNTYVATEKDLEAMEYAAGVKTGTFNYEGSDYANLSSASGAAKITWSGCYDSAGNPNARSYTVMEIDGDLNFFGKETIIKGWWITPRSNNILKDGAIYANYTKLTFEKNTTTDSTYYQNSKGYILSLHGGSKDTAESNNMPAQTRKKEIVVKTGMHVWNLQDFDSLTVGEDCAEQAASIRVYGKMDCDPTNTDHTRTGTIYLYNQSNIQFNDNAIQYIGSSLIQPTTTESGAIGNIVSDKTGNFIMINHMILTKHEPTPHFQTQLQADRDRHYKFCRHLRLAGNANIYKPAITTDDDGTEIAHISWDKDESDLEKQIDREYKENNSFLYNDCNRVTQGKMTFDAFIKYKNMQYFKIKQYTNGVTDLMQYTGKLYGWIMNSRIGKDKVSDLSKGKFFYGIVEKIESANRGNYRISFKNGGATCSGDVYDKAVSKFKRTYKGLDMAALLGNEKCHIACYGFKEGEKPVVHKIMGFILVNNHGLFCESFYETEMFNAVCDHIFQEKLRGKYIFYKPVEPENDYLNPNFISDGVIQTRGTKEKIVLEVFGRQEQEYMERKEEKMRTCKSEAIFWDTSDTDSWAECVEKISQIK